MVRTKPDLGASCFYVASFAAGPLPQYCKSLHLIHVIYSVFRKLVQRGRTLRRQVAGLGATLYCREASGFCLAARQSRQASPSRQNAMRLNSYWTAPESALMIEIASHNETESSYRAAGGAFGNARLVNLPSEPVHSTHRPMFGKGVPRVEGHRLGLGGERARCIHRQSARAIHSLLCNVKRRHGDWGRNVLIPFDGNILDGHFLRIRLQLHLEIENRFLFLQLARKSLTQVVRRSIFGRCRALQIRFRAERLSISPRARRCRRQVPARTVRRSSK